MVTIESKSQIDKLGERLRSEKTSDADLVMLDKYRLSFAEAYDATVRIINDKLGLVTTGRPAKSTQSIREKLQRESIRLSQIQDIAGCRIVVLNVEHQETVLSLLENAARSSGLTTTTFDRRVKPSFGYRAVHVIFHVKDRSVEVQIRTELQHVWAQLSEKLSDLFDPAIKYGGGEARLKAQLNRFSNHISEVEADEEQIWLMKLRVRSGEIEHTPELFETSEQVHQRWIETRNTLYQMMADILRLTGDIMD